MAAVVVVLDVVDVLEVVLVAVVEVVVVVLEVVDVLVVVVVVAWLRGHKRLTPLLGATTPHPLGAPRHALGRPDRGARPSTFDGYRTSVS